MPGLPNFIFCVCRVARQRYRSRHCWRTQWEDSEPTVAYHLRFSGKHARFKITETIWIPDSQNPDLESPYYFGKLDIMVRFNPLVLDQIFINYLKTKPVSLGHLTIRQLSTKLYYSAIWMGFVIDSSLLAKMDKFLGCLLLRLCLYSRYPKMGHVNSQNIQYLWSGIHKLLPLKFLSCFWV